MHLLSIVVPTVTRANEFSRFLNSLESQLGLEWVQCIVVDQNEDDRIAKIIFGREFKFSIKHIRANRISLANAKNQGLQFADGKFCCFLDDDCWLDAGFMFSLLPVLPSVETGRGLLLQALTPAGVPLLPNAIPMGFRLSNENIFDAFCAPQITQVLPTLAVRAVNGFNERLGIGAEFGSAEDTDLLVRVVKSGVVFDYQPALKVFHPAVDHSTMAPMKSYQYGLGFGAFCRIHGWGGYWFVRVLRSLIATIIYSPIRPQVARSYLATLFGRVAGYLRYGD